MPGKALLESDERLRHIDAVGFMIAFVLALGAGNFAMQRAVLESGHPMLARLPLPDGVAGARIALALEFAVLLIALWLVRSGYLAWGVAYLRYSALNGLGAWLILTRRW